ncbi:hypothetical protein YPPY76_2085 [Yersinia pestis PY-76]|nr:hypothetical protein YPPY76_2085 [Yersinia pestis PY-76]
MARLELHGCIYGVFYDLPVLSVAGTLSITSTTDSVVFGGKI